MRHVALRDASRGSDVGEFRRCVRRPADVDLVAVLEQAHAERLVVLQARSAHLDVALLEHFEREHSAGKQHRLEREQG